MSGYVTKIHPLGDDRVTDIRTNPLGHAKRVFLFFLQELFREINPTGYRYMEDVKESQIIIKSTYGKNQETYEKKPIILVDRGNAQIQSRTLGSTEHVDYKTGGKTRTELVPFSLTARILSENEYTAEMLSWFVTFNTFMLRHVLIRQGFYNIANHFIIAAPTAPSGVVTSDQTQLIMVQLTLPCQHLMTGRFVPLNYPILKDVSTKVVDTQSGDQLIPEPSQEE